MEQMPVIVGIDGSEESNRAVSWAIDDARSLGTAVRLVHAYAARRGRRLRTVHSQYPFRTPDTEKELEVEMEKLVESTRTGDTEIEVEHVVLEGHPIEALIEQSKGASLLVVGSRTHHAMAGTLLSSVSQGVLHHAACSVAVVHQDDYQNKAQKEERP